MSDGPPFLCPRWQTIREILPLTADVKLQGGTDTIRIVTINEQVVIYGERWMDPWKSGSPSMPTRGTGCWSLGLESFEYQFIFLFYLAAK